MIKFIELKIIVVDFNFITLFHLFFREAPDCAEELLSLLSQSGTSIITKHEECRQLQVSENASSQKGNIFEVMSNSNKSFKGKNDRIHVSQQCLRKSSATVRKKKKPPESLKCVNMPASNLGFPSVFTKKNRIQNVSNVPQLKSLLTDGGCIKPYFGFDRMHFESRLRLPHCYLCSDNLGYTQKSLLHHLNNFHLSSYVTVFGIFSVKCHLSCSDSEEGHFHCPGSTCKKIFSKKHLLERHLKKHGVVKVESVTDQDLDPEDFTTIVINSNDEGHFASYNVLDRSM